MKQIIIFLLSIFPVSLSFGQNPIGFNYEINERILSARALGLGGAYTSFVDDATGLHYNPAALGFLTGTSVVVSGGLIKNFGDLEATDTYSGNFYSDQTATFSDSPFKPYLNQLALASPIMIGENLVITPAIGFSVNSSNFYRKEKWVYEIEEYDDFGNSITGTNTYTFSTEGGRKDLSYGFGIVMFDNISFGFTQHRFSGERKIMNTFQYINNGTSQPTQTDVQQVDFSGNRTTFGFKYASYGYLEPEDDDYETGIDVSAVLDLPTTLVSKVISNGTVIDYYFREGPTFKVGFSGRSESTVGLVDLVYKPAIRNTTTANQSGTLTRIASDTNNVLSVGIGIESIKVLRAGIRMKQYQFKNEENKQPWTFQATGGISFTDVNHYFFFDIGASFEFYNWSKVLTVNNYGYVDYKGVLMNLLASVRIQIPY